MGGVVVVVCYVVGTFAGYIYTVGGADASRTVCDLRTSNGTDNS